MKRRWERYNVRWLHLQPTSLMLLCINWHVQYNIRYRSYARWNVDKLSMKSMFQEVKSHFTICDTKESWTSLYPNTILHSNIVMDALIRKVKLQGCWLWLHRDRHGLQWNMKVVTVRSWDSSLRHRGIGQSWHCLPNSDGESLYYLLLLLYIIIISWMQDQSADYLLD